jgi:hypothetical protein
MKKIELLKRDYGDRTAACQESDAAVISYQVPTFCYNHYCLKKGKAGSIGIGLFAFAK